MFLAMKYGDITSAVNRANQFANELGGYCDALSSKINKKIDRVEGGSSSNLNDSKYYVNAKINNLRKKQEDAKTLSKRLETLKDTAQRVDGNVKSAIEKEQKSFFKKNPSLKPSKTKMLWTSIVCKFKDIHEGIGNFIDDLVTGVSDAMKAIWHEIKEFWKNNWESIVAVFVIALVSIACILSGGTLAIIGAGLAFGLLSTMFSDVATNLVSGKRFSEWKLSTWEEYTGASVGNAAGFFFGAATGQWGAGSGAVTSFVTSLTTSTLKVFSGKSDKSLLEIGFEAYISGAVGGLIGGVLDKAMNSNAMKSFDEFIGKMFNREAGALFGSGSNIGSLRMVMRKLYKGSFTEDGVKNLGIKTIKNIVVVALADSSRKTIKKIAKNYIQPIVMENLVTPTVKFFERTFDLPPLYEIKASLPFNKEAYDIIKATKKLVFS